jgi:hypothetical protein
MGEGKHTKAKTKYGGLSTRRQSAPPAVEMTAFVVTAEQNKQLQLQRRKAGPSALAAKAPPSLRMTLPGSRDLGVI